jgi:hypothetical protein
LLINSYFVKTLQPRNLADRTHETIIRNEMKTYEFTFKIFVSLLMLTGGPTALAQDIVQGPSEAFGDAYGETAIPEKEFTFSFGPPASVTPELSLIRDVIISFTEKSFGRREWH